MSDHTHEASGESRREFLKKAGKVAWIVPTIQVVNMAGAAAGDLNGSAVTTTSTSSTTTEPPECREFVYYRLKADWNGQSYDWQSGIGANDCITEGSAIDGDDLGGSLSISGDERSATVRHTLENCEIVRAAHKAGQACVEGHVAADGSYAMFEAGDGQDISHVELLVKCCADEVE